MRTMTLTMALATLLLISGCVRQANTKSAPASKKRVMHIHPDKGPHGGPLAEWGDEEYHVEFTVDHPKKLATVYLLDGSVKKPAPIPAETLTLTLTNIKPTVQVVLKADPQDDDPKGQASRFSGTHEQLGKEMDFQGEISGTVAGKPYEGTFEEKDHEHKQDKKK